MSTTTRAADVLARLPKGPVVGAEVGIWKGKMSVGLLSRHDLKLYMVDHWQPIPEYGDVFTAEKQIRNKGEAINVTEFASGRRVILDVPSADAVRQIAEPLDFVYIDADHSYQGVKQDIENWLPHIKEGGLIGGHDYNNPGEKNTEEVVAAVNEAAERYGWALEITPSHSWFARI